MVGDARGGGPGWCGADGSVSEWTQGWVEAAGEGWADVFLADEKLYEKKASDLIPIFKSVTGKGDSVAGRDRLSHDRTALPAPGIPASRDTEPGKVLHPSADRYL